MKDRLSADEALAVYDLCRYAVHARRVEESEDTEALRSALVKLRSQAQRLLCGNCHDRPSHAKGLCDTCYRYEQRTGNQRPVSWAS